ncbi:signal peptidase I [uncultured Oscillibacter sp.]|uniref:signal peptidase I n=1 Tax=uncultured Oscillibacter sp. TaxID=876091 RepID=UPI0025D3D691|nr:signal peptidase I [uncultured Oscillibacter sp.]
MGKRTRGRMPGQELYEWAQALVCSVLAVVVLFTFAVRIIGVSGGSMRETLQDGDLLLVLDGWLCGDYVPGDIVILCKPGFHEGNPIVKRVVAAAGQTVDIDFALGTVYVDGAALEEPYTREPTFTDEGTEFPLTVPEGCVFVMGDNRNGSDDSRNPALGPVDIRGVIGRAFYLAVPGAAEETKERNWSRMGMLNQED